MVELIRFGGFEVALLLVFGLCAWWTRQKDPLFFFAFGMLLVPSTAVLHGLRLVMGETLHPLLIDLPMSSIGLIWGWSLLVKLGWERLFSVTVGMSYIAGLLWVLLGWGTLADDLARMRRAERNIQVIPFAELHTARKDDVLRLSDGKCYPGYAGSSTSRQQDRSVTHSVMVFDTETWTTQHAVSAWIIDTNLGFSRQARESRCREPMLVTIEDPLGSYRRAADNALAAHELTQDPNALFLHRALQRSEVYARRDLLRSGYQLILLCTGIALVLVIRQRRSHDEHATEGS